MLTVLVLKESINSSKYELVENLSGLLSDEDQDDMIIDNKSAMVSHFTFLDES